MQKSTSEVVVERFYSSLDPEVETTLTPEQKTGIEQALVSSTLAARHPVDFRHSFSFFHRRYFVVFLFGRDKRKKPRDVGTFGRVLSTLGVMFLVLFCVLSVLLALYMIKSALGIDVFKHFHVGIWGWFIQLHDKMS
ncbi:hypothetical protein [Scandinavium goeteborgense]|uniref:3-phosphoshikimate 1-carboxyvinyltransferase n=1 Tax=Scandinavium goeteborgense TaxID=1851514 RepID=A0A4R6ELJ2_SCAGO|nr:hypothetical protein [Scandinavium goeteborgense]TDN59834.1 hypothetical protein EC847_1035 [Scandinavium goeteborgense]